MAAAVDLWWDRVADVGGRDSRCHGKALAFLTDGERSADHPHATGAGSPYTNAQADDLDIQLIHITDQPNPRAP